MGWTTCMHASFWKYDKKGNRTVDRKKELDALFTHERKAAVESYGCVYPPMKDTVIKSAMVGSVYYAAVKREEPGKEPMVWAAICLTSGRGRDGSVWGFKDMDETMHPFYYGCPAGILALLTPTDNESANQWRESCRKAIARKAEERRNGPKQPFVPLGVSVEQKGLSWIITSKAYREKTNYRYAGIRFSKARWHDVDNAMYRFLEEFGTKEQKAEYAASGRNCPSSWKVAAA